MTLRRCFMQGGKTVKKLIILHILLVNCMLMVVTTDAANLVTDGLVSYWTFDRTDVNDGIAEDIWGENDAQIMGNTKISTGYFRQGLEFDGSGDYVILPNISDYISSIRPSSFEFWFKTTQNSRPSTFFKVLESVCANKDRAWGIDINLHNEIAIPLNPQDVGVKGEEVFRESSLLIQYANFRNKSCSSASIEYRIPVSDGEWHHLVLVSGALYIDVAGKRWSQYVLYIDNIPYVVYRVRGRNPDDFVPYTEPIYLGATNNKGVARGYYYQGSFDEVRVYDRALTHNEVTQNFASGDFLSVKSVDKLPVVWGGLKQRK